jgi:hypothetical protein
MLLLYFPAVQVLDDLYRLLYSHLCEFQLEAYFPQFRLPVVQAGSCLNGVTFICFSLRSLFLIERHKVNR